MNTMCTMPWRMDSMLFSETLRSENGQNVSKCASKRLDIKGWLEIMEEKRI